MKLQCIPVAYEIVAPFLTLIASVVVMGNFMTGAEKRVGADLHGAHQPSADAVSCCLGMGSKQGRPFSRGNSSEFHHPFLQNAPE